ncbi:Adenylate cyclase [Diplonema papillatum]|nr:Adenylate cyclase [Diplonema papillatum]
MGCLPDLQQLLYLAAAEGDTEGDRLSKAMILLFSAAALGITPVATVYYVAEDHVLGMVTSLVLAVASALMATRILVSRAANAQHVAIYFGIALATAMVHDWFQAAAQRSRTWPCFLIILNAVLVAGNPMRCGRAFAAVSALWIVVLTAEDGYRWGLYDTPIGLLAKEALKERNSCDAPPCPLGARSFASGGLALLILFLNYALTGSLLRRVSGEAVANARTVEITRAVIQSAATFDLEAADAKLSEGQPRLARPLAAALEALLQSLFACRPFLPDAALPGCGSPPHDMAHAPGIASHRAAVVFTDVCSASLTWETCAEAMRKAVQVHNRVLRSVISSAHGYEVKTSGDSFMVAFEKLSAAVAFGLQAQLRLFEAAWPAAIEDLPQCASGGCWKGLRVRVGIQHGDVQVQLNEATNRLDYAGPAVAVAARLKNACMPGAVALSEESWNAVSASNRLPTVAVSAGVVELKGAAAVDVMLLYPASLSQRFSSGENDGGEHTAFKSVTISSRPKASLGADLVGSGRPRSSRSSRSDKRSERPVRLERIAQATVALVEVKPRICVEAAGLQFAMDDILTRTITAAARSDGTVFALLGGCVAVGWNTQVRSATHVESSFRFMNLLHKDLSARPTQCAAHIGACTSSVFMGPVGGAGQSFLTVFGEGVRLSSHVAAAAARLEVSALYCPCLPVFESDPQLKLRTRPVEKWEVGSSHLEVCELVTLYQVRLQSLDESKRFARPFLARCENDPVEEMEFGWSADYWAIFDEGDSAALRSKIRDSSDKILMKVAEGLDRGNKQVFCDVAHSGYL